MHPTLISLMQHKLVPVITIENAENTDALCDALCEGGLPVAEITFRTDAAAAAIRRAAKKPGMLVGAGTVLTVEQAQQAVDAGATYIISPGVSPAVIEWCIGNDIAVTPGIATPTDIQTALACGADTLKFFPASAFGGIPTLKMIGAPFPQVKFIPTGGIDTENVNDYLALPSVIACGGSWLTPSKLIREGNWRAIGETVRKAVEAVAQ